MATGDRTITRIRRPHRGKLSTATGGSDETLEITAVAILPRQGQETEKGWVNVEGWDIWVLPTSKVQLGEGVTRQYQDDDILSSDFVSIDGVEWAADGPDAVFTKRGRFKGAKIQVQKVGVL